MDAMAFNLYNMNNVGFGSVSNPFSASSAGADFANPFSSITNSLPAFGGGDFMSTFSMFNCFLNGQMPMMWQNKFFTTNFNTNSNLPQLSAVKYSKNMGNSLANIAYRNASQTNSRHQCLKGVRQSLNQKGLVDGNMGGSAYQAASVLEHNKNFKEVNVSREDLKNLPAGCVIVWDRNYVGTKSSDLHGHIAVTLGDGREASDHVAGRTYLLNSRHRVFVPVDRFNKTA